MTASRLLRFRIVIVVTALAIGSLVAPAQEKAAAPPNPKAWSVRVYRYPSDELNRGFATRDRGQLRAPALPAKEAKEEDQIAFLQRSTDIVGTYLDQQGVLIPKGSLFAYDRTSQTLAARTTEETHGRIEMLAKAAQSSVGQYLTFNVQVVEADAGDVRASVKEAATRADHTPILAKYQDEITQGQAKALETIRLETRSGQRASNTSTQGRQYPTEFMTDEAGRSEISQEVRPVGPRLEIDPVIGPDGVTVDINYAIDHHFAPPTDRWEPTALTGPKRLETRVVDFHTASLKSAITLLSGSTKLLGVWAPEGATGADAPKRMEMAFLRAHVVSVLTQADNRVEQMIAALGEKAAPIPAAEPAEAKPKLPALPAGMEVRRYRVPADFLARDPAKYQGAAAAAPADPFAPAGGAGEPTMAVRMTALDILRARGIVFPEGSSASFIPTTSELVVRNTPENLKKLEDFLESIRDIAPMNVAITCYIVQGEAAAMRAIEAETAPIADHTEVWRRLEAEAAQGRMKILRTTWIETRSGQRATTQAGDEHIFFTEMSVGSLSKSRAKTKTPAPNVPAPQNTTAPDSSDGTNLAFSPTFEMTMVGTSIEVDPVIGPDSKTIDVNIAISQHTAPPTLRHDPIPAAADVIRVDAPGTDFHEAKLTTAMTFTSGMTRLAGMWKPDAASDGPNGTSVLQAAFVKADILKVEAEGKK